MFAIVRTGGKQYRVAAGDKIAVDRMAGEAGDTVSLGEALFASDGGEVKSGLTVSAEIIAQAKADKIIVFKKKRRHNYRRKAGHRQQHTILKIVSVGEDKPAKMAKKAEAEPAPGDVEPTQGTPAQTEAPVSEAKPAKAPKAAKPAIAASEAAPGAIDTPVDEAKPTKRAAAAKPEAAPEPEIPAGEAKKASAKKRAE